MCGGINNIDDNLNYFAQYFNETGVFILNFAAYDEMSQYFSFSEFEETNFRVGFDYLKSMSFSNITDFNQV